MLVPPTNQRGPLRAKPAPEGRRRGAAEARTDIPATAHINGRLVWCVKSDVRKRMKEEDHNCFMWLRTRGRPRSREKEERHETRARGKRAPSRVDVTLAVKARVIRFRIT